MKVQTMMCPGCGDILYTRDEFDYRSCTCGDSYVSNFHRYGGNAVHNGEMEIDATQEDLRKDWMSWGDKFGLIKGNNLKESKD